MVVRHENSLNLIWSNRDKGYFIANDGNIDKEVSNIIRSGNGNLEVKKELEQMGLEDGLKEIHTQKNTNGLNCPLEYYFDYTDACNLKCTHCYNREQLNNNTMTEEQIEYIIKDMYENGIMRLHLAGGEPTLFPDKLRKYMSTAKKYGIVTSMSSNGTTITDEIGKILIDNDVTSFTISIESAYEEKNAKIRGAGVLNKSIEGIKKIIAYRAQNNGKFNVAIKMSYDVDTRIEDFQKMIDLAIDLKVDVLKLINPERCTFHEKKYYSKVADKYFKVQKIIRDLSAKYKEKLNITIVNSPVNLYCTSGLPNMKGCIGAQELVAINPNGDVTPCLMNKYNLGNIFENKSMKDIYSGDRIQKYRAMISDYDCKDCGYHEQCRGGCQVRKIVEYGKITSTDPLCPKKYNEDTKEIEKEKQKYKYFKRINVYHSL